MSPAERVGRAKGEFDTIRLAHEGQDEMGVAFDEKRFAAIAAAKEAKGGVQVLAPIGCGKTIGAETYADRVNSSAEPGKTPVLIATLDISGTARSVPAAILRALKEPRSDRGNETLLWMRAKCALQDHEVELLILDEMDRASRRPSIAHHIAGSLRDLSDERIVPLAFLCTEKSISLFRNCPDLDERLDAPVVLHPLDWMLEEDRETLIRIVRGFDEAIAEKGILPEPSGLDDPEIVRRIATASNGILRRMKLIIGTAMVNVVRNGGTVIGFEDLETAVQEYAIAKGFIADNPFSSGQ